MDRVAPVGCQNRKRSVCILICSPNEDTAVYWPPAPSPASYESAHSHAGTVVQFLIFKPARPVLIVLHNESMSVLFWWYKSLPLNGAPCQRSSKHSLDSDGDVSQQNQRGCQSLPNAFATGYANAPMSSEGERVGNDLEIQRRRSQRSEAPRLARCSHVTPIIQIGSSPAGFFLPLLWCLFIVGCWIILLIQPLDMWLYWLQHLWFKAQLTKKHHRCLFITLNVKDALAPHCMLHTGPGPT